MIDCVLPSLKRSANEFCNDIWMISEHRFGGEQGVCVKVNPIISRLDDVDLQPLLLRNNDLVDRVTGPDIYLSIEKRRHVILDWDLRYPFRVHPCRADHCSICQLFVAAQFDANALPLKVFW